MAAIKKYFKKEFQLSMLDLQHDDLTDFYLSSCQKSRSAVPLLCLRTVAFLGCLGIIISSMILTNTLMSIGHWFIFLTHWGVILLILTSGSAALVSLKAHLGDPNDTPRNLMLYVQIHWVFYNITVPVALLITIFYWAFITGTVEMEGMDPVLDVFVHGVNAIVILVLLAFSRVPWRLMHVVHPIAFCVVYLIFSIIYYYAGGLSPTGDVHIYPILDWSSPGITMITVVGTVVFLMVAHVLVALLTIGRDKLSKRFFRDTKSIDIYNDPYN